MLCQLTMRLSISSFLLLGFIDFCLLSLEDDECKGMSKAMKRIKCKKVVTNIDDLNIRNNDGQNFTTVVQDQYTDLPYPPFSVFDMVEEQKYYATQPEASSRPKFYQHTNSLNVINHYLYKVKDIKHIFFLVVCESIFV